MSRQQEHINEFTTLLQQHEKLVYKVCSIYTNNTEDSKDLFQEIVVQVWIAYPKFQQQSKVSTWLYRIALNTAISYKRKTGKVSIVPMPGFLANFSDASSDQEEYKILQTLISNLPALEKALILLYMEDNSYQEIADIMGITVTNVGTRLNRIKDKLKQQAHTLINL